MMMVALEFMDFSFWKFQLTSDMSEIKTKCALGLALRNPGSCPAFAPKSWVIHYNSLNFYGPTFSYQSNNVKGVSSVAHTGELHQNLLGGFPNIVKYRNTPQPKISVIPLFSSFLVSIPLFLPPAHVPHTHSRISLLASSSMIWSGGN